MTKVTVLNKERNSTASTNETIYNKIVKVVNNDESTARQVRVTFSELLVNPFKVDVFNKKDKLDELYNYFINP